MANPNLGVVFRDPLGHPLAPFFDERQHVLPVCDVLLFCSRCSGTLEVVRLQKVLDFLVVGAGLYEVLKVEEVHKPLEPLLPLPEEFEKVLVVLTGQIIALPIVYRGLR